MINIIHEIIEKLPIHDSEKADLHDKLNASTAEETQDA